MELIRTTRTASKAMLIRRSLRLAELKARTRNQANNNAATGTTTNTNFNAKTINTFEKKRKAVFDFDGNTNKKRKTMTGTPNAFLQNGKNEQASNKKNTSTPAEPSPNKEIEVCISFDTTCSMYSCLRELRRSAKQTIERLLRDIPNIRIALVAHGDYGDEESTYLIKMLDFTNNGQELVYWINNVGGTYGFDTDECYELVLRNVQSLSWSPTCHNRSFVLVGDANPHPLTTTTTTTATTTTNAPNQQQDRNPYQIDWKKEAQNLKEMNIHVYAVHALGGDFSKEFYQSLALITDGTYLKLPQFDLIAYFLCGICYRQNNLAQVEAYEKELEEEEQQLVPTADASSAAAVQQLFDTLLGRGGCGDDSNEEEEAVVPVVAGKNTQGRRFKTLQIVHRTKSIPIKTFMNEKRLGSKTGRTGFYQVTKPEMINPKKGIVLVDKKSGEMFIGKSARMLLGFTTTTTAPEEEAALHSSKRIKPLDYMDFDIFVQSTVPRKDRILMGGTKFMYEETSPAC